MGTLIGFGTKLAAIYKKLRRDRELSFYGAEDLTPSQFYSEEDAAQALAEARLVFKLCRQGIPK